MTAPARVLNGDAVYLHVMALVDLSTGRRDNYLAIFGRMHAFLASSQHSSTPFKSCDHCTGTEMGMNPIFTSEETDHGYRTTLGVQNCLYVPKTP